MNNENLMEFLKDFVLSDSQVKEIYKRFCGEISKGLNKDTHSQSDIKCYVTYVQELPTGDEIGQYLALDLGGTNFRVLLVTLKGHHDALVKSKIFAIPKEIMLGPGTQLFDHIAKCLAEFVCEHQLGDAHLPLAFTFSFPCIQLGLTKALLVKWTKGFNCSGVEQEDVVRLLKEAIDRRNDLCIEVMAILNDATGTLMSCAHRSSECRIGVIVGTGCNACYVEDTKNADLLEEEYKNISERILINTEWGAFGESGILDFVRTEYDKIVDRDSLNVGNQLFEKMISGMYLGELVRLILVRLLKENRLFANQSSKNNILTMIQSNSGCFETRFLSEIEGDSFPAFTHTKRICKEVFNVEKASVEDCQKLRLVCETVSKRAATLVGIALSGLINRINERKVVVGVDGSVYRFHPKFDSYLRETMRKMVKPTIQFDLMLSEDGSGRGAALVAAVVASNCQ